MYGHLSRLIVTDKLKRYSRFSSDGPPYTAKTQSCNGWGLHGTPCHQSVGELLPRLSILTEILQLRRFISVALSLKSPSPDVIRHPVLCCSDFPHGKNAPRPYNKLKSIYIIAYFIEKVLLFYTEYDKIYLKFFIT